MKRNYVKHTLRGDGMVALSTHGLNLMSNLINKWNNPGDPHPPLNPDEIQFFLAKLCHADFIAYLDVGIFKLGQAIRNKQPQMITLLSQGNVESDMALIHFCKKNSAKEFLKIVENIPELMSRIKDCLFLERFLRSSFISNNEKSWFVDEFLLHFTLKQFSLLCSNVKKRVLYSEEWENGKLNALQNQFIEKLVIEPNDQVFIDELFKSSFIDEFINNERFLTRLRNIQSKEMQDYFYKKSLSSYLEKIIKKAMMVLLCIESKFLHKLSDQQLIFLANPVAYQAGYDQNSPSLNFSDFLRPLFSTGRMTKDLFLALTEVPGIQTLLNASILKLHDLYLDQYSCVQNDLALAFEIVNYGVGCNEECLPLLGYLTAVIQKFSLQQRIILLGNTVYPRNREYFEKFFTFEELRALRQTATTKIPDSLQGDFFVNRLSAEASTEKFTTEVVRCGITNTTSWNRQYPAFATRLRQPDVYPFVFGKCVSLLATNDVKPLDQTILNWLELLAFLQKLSPIHNEMQKHTILGAIYFTTIVYTLVCNYEQKQMIRLSKHLQNLFYPLCLNLLDLADLQRLKQHFSPNTLKDYLFPNTAIRAVEKALTTKVRAGEAATVGECCYYAIPAPERNWIFVLLFLGIGGFIAGLASGLAIVSMIALIPLLCGVGMGLIPIGSSLLSRLTFSRDVNIGNTDQATSHIPYSKLWFGILIGVFVLGFVVTAPVLSAVHAIILFAIGIAAAVSIASIALFFSMAYVAIPEPENAVDEDVQHQQNTASEKILVQAENSLLPALQGQHKALFASDAPKEGTNTTSQSSEVLQDFCPNLSNSSSASSSNE